MYKWLNLLIALILISTYAFAQADTCKCIGNGYDNKQPDTVFAFSNGHLLGLCGYREERPDIFSEFVLIDCESNKAIGFWDATVNCKVLFKNDTLLIEEMIKLPVGKDFSYQPVVWSTEKIYTSNNSIARSFKLNKQIKPYTQDDIDTVLKEYESASKGLEEDKIVLANKLFVASISGSKKALDYFKSFGTRFGVLDGAFAEEYHDLKGRLAIWQKK